MLSLARHDDVNTSTTFELAKEFVKSNQVLIVEHPYTWAEVLRNFTKRKTWLRLRASIRTKPLIKTKGKIKILVPPVVIPINFLSYGKRYKGLSRWNHRLVSKRINTFLLSTNWLSYEFINSYNYHFPYLHFLLIGKQVNRVYHCVDPIVKPYTMKHGIRNQKEAIHNSDMVISTAPQLQRQWETKKPSFLVPNAVNYEHFNSPQQYVPKIRGLGQKIVGYFGVIERRIDFELLINTFKNKPDWTLLLAGPIEEGYVPEAIKLMPNVHFSGRYSYSDLPAMIYSVDATIIPFKMDDASKSIYPLKLYEYMSTGKPIVCTLFNPDLLLPLEDQIYLASDFGTFEKAIGRALIDKDLEAQLSRKTFASMNTWENRAQLFLNYLKKPKNEPVEKSY